MNMVERRRDRGLIMRNTEVCQWNDEVLWSFNSMFVLRYIFKHLAMES